ncbi:aspartate kinase [Membranihabitans marinus]|uniref:aspartate kinase n=1 Tax=Membranihabitans marinus TaxID=1227546 RepID=UPI001F005287|nr:aspartate kinase [Membranihabitans marinus]
MENCVVYKFGGASVKNASAIQNVGRIISNCPDGKLIVVVSAMGKTTNALEEVVATAFKNPTEAVASLQTIKASHLEIATELDLNIDLSSLFEEGEKNILAIRDEELEYDFIYDQIVSLGELASTKIVNAYLAQSLSLEVDWLDARRVVKTDNTYREGRINWNETSWLFQKTVQPLFKSYNVLVTQGFIGADDNNHTVTLGREGSDYSAAIFSYCLDASYMAIWKDVPGILTADPRLFENVSLIDKLSYLEAIEMTYYGAKVIHPKTIKPLQNKNIPLYVKSFENPSSAGTVIAGELDLRYPPVVVVEKDQRLLYIRTKDLSFVAEHHLSRLFNLFAKHRIKVNLMRNTAISFTVCVTDRPDRIANLLAEIDGDFTIEDEKNLELITIRHYQQPVVDALKKGKIVLFEERIPKTVQLVLKSMPLLKRKDVEYN